MATRRRLVLILAGVFSSLGATHRTQNFVVEAHDIQTAQQVGQYAEHYRKEKAQEWLGQEMPPWPQPCPLRVTLTMNGAGGATTFSFENGRVFQQMHIEGSSLERLLNSVLPHEVTHTVFAHHFRCPLPRWADEGGAVLSEDDKERNHHDMLVRQILNDRRAIPLNRLFALREYPSDVMALYAEGYSVANFLVGRSSRQVFLAFVAHGMRYGWDSAVQAHYGHNNVNELEQAWFQHLRDTRRPQTLLAQNTRPTGSEPAGKVVVRQTVPPAQPFDSPGSPTYRGVAAEPGRENDRFQQPARAASAHSGQAPPPSWPADDSRQAGPSRVILGAPQFDPQPSPAQLGQPQPAAWSPVGSRR